VKGCATALAALALALAAAAPAAAAGGSLTDTSDPGSFPYRTWALSLPADKAVEPGEVRVLENGASVRDLQVETSATSGAQSRRFATVLVIDASKSMRGDPIQGAMSAARAFARQRREHQALGVVAFNENANVLLEPTTDAGAIADVLGQTPELARGTHIRDAVGTGLDLLGKSGAEVGSLVVLSDGDDTGSVASSPAITGAARRQQARVFTVGLRSNVYTPRSLAGLAKATGGTATVADSPEGVKRAFAALGSRLGGEYLVRYQSREVAGSRVRVDVDVDGGSPEAVAEYQAPVAATAVAPGTRSGEAFWASSSAMVGVTLACMLLVALSAGLVLRRPAQAPLADRINAYASDEARVPESGDHRAYTRAAEAVERMLSAAAYWERFTEDVEVARVPRSASELALLAGGAFALFTALGLLLGSSVLMVPAVLAPVGIVVFVRAKAGRERAKFGDQLADSLQVFASAMRAGHSFTGALGAVVKDAPEPAQREFSRALADERLGVPIDDALGTLGRRMRSREMSQVAMIAALQQETGGNTAEVLDRVVDNVRERQSLRRLVRSLTAQGRLSQMVVTALPIALALLMALTNPGYLSPLVESGGGRIMIVVAVIMLACGSLAIRKIVRIKI
jgi:tight adherence protein B